MNAILFCSWLSRVVDVRALHRSPWPQANSQSVRNASCATSQMHTYRKSHGTQTWYYSVMLWKIKRFVPLINSSLTLQVSLYVQKNDVISIEVTLKVWMTSSHSYRWFILHYISIYRIVCWQHSIIQLIILLYGSITANNSGIIAPAARPQPPPSLLYYHTHKAPQCFKVLQIHVHSSFLNLFSYLCLHPWWKQIQQKGIVGIMWGGTISPSNIFLP